MSQPILKTLAVAACAVSLGAGSVLPTYAIDGTGATDSNLTENCADASCGGLLGDAISTTADANNAAYQANYDAAVASITELDTQGKLSALKNAITAVNTEIPHFVEYNRMRHTVQIMQGRSCHIDALSNLGGCAYSVREKLIYDLAVANGEVSDPIGVVQWIDSNPEAVAKYDGFDLNDIVATMKGLPDHIPNSAELQKEVEGIKASYDAAVSYLRTDLLNVDPTLGDLSEKDGHELVALYENLPIVKDGTYNNLFSALDNASYIVDRSDSFSDGTSDNAIERVYGTLVANALAIDPEFKVTLPADEEEKKVPTVPNTGSTLAEMSAVIVSVALGGVVAVASLAGVARLFKLYHASPLKRRK